MRRISLIYAVALNGTQWATCYSQQLILPRTVLVFVPLFRSLAGSTGGTVTDGAPRLAPSCLVCSSSPIVLCTLALWWSPIPYALALKALHLVLVVTGHGGVGIYSYVPSL